MPKTKEKGRDLTQSYDKSPCTNRNVRQAVHEGGKDNIDITKKKRNRFTGTQHSHLPQKVL